MAVFIIALTLHAAPATAQSTPQRVSYTAGFASVKPDIDGVWQPNEWNDANELQVSTDASKSSPDLAYPCKGQVYVRLKHDNSSLFGLVDVVSDNGSTWMEGSKGPYDGVVILTFDADNYGNPNFGKGGTTYEIGFNKLWPNITFVSDSVLNFKSQIMVAIGFGSSPHNSTNHKIYEFSMPLEPLLKYAPIQNGEPVMGFDAFVVFPSQKGSSSSEIDCLITSANLGPNKGPMAGAELYLGPVVVPENIDLIMPLILSVAILSVAKRKLFKK